MPGHGRKQIDETLILALACGATAEAAAQKAGVAVCTVYRRLKEPAFKQRLQALRGEMVQRSASMLTAAAMEAVKTLLALQQASVPASVRLGAARAILEMGVRLREAADLEERVAVLEQMAGDRGVLDRRGP
jgi:hypothetical protein